MKKIILTAAVLLSVLPFSNPARAAGEGIAAIVNSEAITNSDVNARMKLIAASTGMPQTPEMMSKLRPQIVDMLVDETLKSQEAKRQKVNVKPEEIEQGFTEIAGNNNVPVEDFKAMLQKGGIDMDTMRDQIRSQIAWGKVIQREVRSKIEVSDSDIDVEIEKFKRKIGQTQYHAFEIYVPVTNPKNDAAARAFVSKVASQLQQEPDAFPKAAQQLSRASDAKRGGDMGWLELGEFPQEVQPEIKKLDLNQISGPIKTQSGYYLVVVREKRDILSLIHI